MTVDRAFAEYRPITKNAMTPPLGWNSWDVFGSNVTEAEVRAGAVVMAERLLPAGYDTLVIDIAWYAPGSTAIGEQYKRPDPHQLIDQWGRLVPDPERFPSSAGGQGFKPLAAWVHSLGLKLGIHVMRGIAIQAVEADTPILGSDRRARSIIKTEDRCVFYDGMYAVDMGRDGAMAYYQSVLDLYASWDIDFIKADDMTTWPQHYDEVKAFRHALDRSGRRMTLSLSPGACGYMERSFVNHAADMFRITGDLWDTWDALKNTFGACRTWKGHTGPGRWADCDMIPIGTINVRGEAGSGERRDRFTPAERRTMLSLWSIFRSPLMLGCDLPRMDAETHALVTNPHMLRCNQASVGNDEVLHGPDVSVWTAADPASGDRWVAMFNLADQARTLSVEADRIGAAAGWTATDVWTGGRRALQGTSVSVEIEAHGVWFARCSRG